MLWSAARAEANLAYDAWCDAPGPDAYAVYRAAEDRADAAEADLAGRRRRSQLPEPLKLGPNGNHARDSCVVQVSSPFERESPSRAMSHADLRSLLDDVPDTLEIVLRRDPTGARCWRRGVTRPRRPRRRCGVAHRARARSYAAYRAAQDREDAAQDALAQTQTSRTIVS